MEQTSVYVILVVSGCEFPVNRRTLAECSPYFRAMFLGGYRESTTDHVELKGVDDSDAFAVVLDFILTGQVKLKDVANSDCVSVLEISDMLNVYTFPDALKRDLFKNWADLETVSSILQLADALDVRSTLLTRIFNILRNTFIVKGRNDLDLHLGSVQSFDIEDCCFSLIDNFPDFVVEFLSIEDVRSSRVQISSNDYQCFLHGLLSWVTEHTLNEEIIWDIVKCVEKPNMSGILELRNVGWQPDFNYFKNIKVTLGKTMSRLLVGWPDTVPVLYNFNLKKWKWKLMELEMPTLGNTDNSSKENLSTWYTRCESFLSDSLLGASSSNEIVYVSVQYKTAEGVVSYQLAIFELDHENGTFSNIFRTTVPMKFKGCSLCRQDDVIHGFATYDEGLFNYTIGHFTLSRNSQDNTWFSSDFRLEPLFRSIETSITPVAATISDKGFLMLFLLSGLDGEIFWLADYNLEYGFLAPLGHLPTLSARDYKAVRSPRKVEFKNTAKEICTLYLQCCGHMDIQVFNLSAVSKASRYCVTCPFLSEHELCGTNVNHMPRIMSAITLRAFT